MLKPGELNGFYCKCFSILKPEKLGPVWNAGISQESYRNFIGISSISQEKRRNGEKSRFPNRPLDGFYTFTVSALLLYLNDNLEEMKSAG